MKIKLWAGAILTGILMGCDQTGASLDNDNEFVSGLDSSLTMQAIYGLPVENLSYICEPEQLDETVVIDVKKTDENGFFTCDRGDKTVTLFLGETKELSIEIASFNLVAVSNQNAFERNEQTATIDGVSTSISVMFPINLAENTNSSIASVLETNIYKILKSMEQENTQNFLVIPNEAHSNVMEQHSIITSENLSDQTSTYDEYLAALNDSLADGNKLKTTSLISDNAATTQLTELASFINAGFFQTAGILDTEDTAAVFDSPILVMPAFLTRDNQWRIIGQAINATSSVDEGLFDVYLDKSFNPSNVTTDDRTQLQNFEFLSNSNSDFIASLSAGDFVFNKYVFAAVDSEIGLTCVQELVNSGQARSDAQDFCDSQLRFSNSTGEMSYQDGNGSQTYRFGAEKSEFVGTSINLASGYAYPIFFTADFIGVNSDDEEVVNETVSFIINDKGNVYRDIDQDCAIGETDDLVGLLRQVRVGTDLPFITFGFLFTNPKQSLYTAFSGFNVGQSSDELASFALQLNLDSYTVSQPVSGSSDETDSARWNLLIDSQIVEGRIENSVKTSACSSNS